MSGPPVMAPGYEREVVNEVPPEQEWELSETAKRNLKIGGIVLLVLTALGILVGGLYAGGQFPHIDQFFKDLFALKLTIGEGLLYVGLPLTVLAILIPLAVYKGPAAVEAIKSLCEPSEPMKL